MRNEEILGRVRAFCEEQRLLGGAQHVVAAVSGGADSMALLRILMKLQPEFGYTLSVCHVNHGLRGETADRDEAFVRAACESLGIPLRVFHAAELGEEFVPPQHPGEDWARRLRYACFERLCAEDAGIDAIATAHTGSDQAETLLFRLARGTGLHGAAGIRPRRGSYVRPLLCLTREDTEAFCQELGQPWVTDETNAADDYARNRLRHAALPALTTVNAAAERNLARFCEQAAQADAYLARQAQSLLEEARVLEPAHGLPAQARYAQGAGQPVWQLEPLQQADEFLLETALHSLVSPVRDAEEKYVRLLAALVRRGSGAVQLTRRVRFGAAKGFFWRQEAAQEIVAAELHIAFRPQDGAEYPLGGGRSLKIWVEPAFFEEKTRDVHKKDLKNQADYAKIATLYPALILRFRRPGDHYRPAGSRVNRELRKWMGEAGIPPAQRGQTPLLAAGSEVVWVDGAGFADGLAPEKSSAQILRLEVKV